MKVLELTGVALDWAVAKCENFNEISSGKTIYVKDGMVVTKSKAEPWGYYRPTEDWAQGGPIIVRELHAFDYMQSERVCAIIKRRDLVNGGWNYGYGPTVLIAAMRCFVASKLGDEIDIPEELK